MQTLEQIIRPFQSRDPSATRRVISNSTKIPDQEAGVEWGNPGDLPKADKVEKDEEGGMSFTVLTCDDNFDERNRKFKTIRIEQPDHPENYIMVDRINRIAFDKKSESNNTTMYNNDATSFVTLPAFDNSVYYKSNYGDGSKKCASTYNLHNG